MPQQPSVLIISHQHTLRHLAEQVCQQAGATTVTATSGQEGSAIAAARGPRGFALVVMDTAEPSRENLSPPRMACQLLQEWTAASPSLPFVFVGPKSQKQALMRIRADSVRFVTPPFSRHTVRQAIESCLPSLAWRAKGFSAPFANKGTSNGRHHDGPNHHRLSRRDAAVQDGVARRAFSAAGADQSGMVPHDPGRREPDGDDEVNQTRHLKGDKYLIMKGLVLLEAEFKPLPA
jgi:CheY-like chemotaxis protein